jgi:hypothetical protein
VVETNNCQLKQAGVLSADGGLERKKAGKSQGKVPAKIPVTGKAKTWRGIPMPQSISDSAKLQCGTY